MCTGTPVHDGQTVGCKALPAALDAHHHRQVERGPIRVNHAAVHAHVVAGHRTQRRQQAGAHTRSRQSST